MLRKIAFFGPMTSGKSYLAEYLMKKPYNFQRFSFATDLKYFASEIFDIRVKDGKSREIYQKFGEFVRSIDEDAWVRRILRQIASSNGGPEPEDRPYNVVIDDVRYPNEYRALRAADFTLIKVTTPLQTRLERIHALYPDTPLSALWHPSETSLEEWVGDYEIDSSDYNAEIELEEIVNAES